MAHFGTDSKEKLATIHPDLQRVLNRAIELYDFKILDGLRDEEHQNQALAEKRSTKAYPNSRHNRSKNPDGTYNYELSDAVDIAPFPIKWPDIRKQTTKEYVKRMGEFYRMAGIIMMAAHTEGVKIRWGGDFISFFDGPHIERVV